MNTTTELEMTDVMVKKVHGLPNQQPSSLKGEGSTISRKTYNPSGLEAPGSLTIRDEDMISTPVERQGSFTRSEMRIAISSEDIVNMQPVEGDNELHGKQLCRLAA